MDYAYIGSIIPWALDWAPQGWAMCNGQSLSIQQNMALYTILGTTYGGNGTTSFNLPNLNGRFPVCASPSYPAGTASGAAMTTVTAANLPPHKHDLGAISSTMPTAMPLATSDAAQSANKTPAAGNFIAKSGVNMFTNTGAADTPIVGLTVSASATIGATGNAQPFSVMPRYQAISYIICITGLYPSRW